MSIARLALGTVQFGLDYGVTNSAGRVSEQDAGAILARAASAGIDLLDTAAAYGESEAVLGRIAAPSFRIMTKVGGPPARFADLARASAARLGRVPDAILLHDARPLMGREAGEVADALRDLKASGLARRIGVSVYTPEALEAACAVLRPDVVQLPFNVFDRRFGRTGWLARLAAEGIEVHARSLFLQGALLAPETPSRLAFAEARFAAFRAACAAEGIDALSASLAAGFAAPLDRLVIGVTSPAELDGVLAAAAAPRTLSPRFDTLATDDLALVDPSRWPPG